MRLVLSSFDYLPTWSSTNSLLGSMAACLEGGHHLFLLNQDNTKVQNIMIYSFLLHVFGNCELCVDLKKYHTSSHATLCINSPIKIIFLKKNGTREIWIKQRRLLIFPIEECLSVDY
uniref:Uncharacterized protein n=1 Tax=Rhipicephalus microplus TaxID=6941 RepID=A0A6G5AGC2_RHIMP